MPESTAGIFISYRRETEGWFAQHLYDSLKTTLGKERVFIDIDNIQPGEDFVEVLEKKLANTVALIVVIGRDWLTCKDADGNLRLANPDDFVRLEVATALQRKVRVIPVLIDGARVPSSRDLPADIGSLSRRQAVEIDRTRFQQDAAKLTEVLRPLLAEHVAEAERIDTPQKADDQPRSGVSGKAESIGDNESARPEAAWQKPLSFETPAEHTRKPWIIALIVGAVLVVSGIIWQSLFRSAPHKTATEEISSSPASTNPQAASEVRDPASRPEPEQKKSEPSPVPARPKAPSGPIHVGGNLQQANLIKQPRPVYPPLAKAARVQGTVKFQATIAKDGTIKDLQLISGQPLLVQSAIDAVKQWVYTPTLINNEPVEVITTIDVDFTLK